jgi:biotin carboxyl carrier protein
LTPATGGAYTPGLKVVGAMRYTARRLLPISGNVLVKAGDRVEARQVVAETFMPGDITPLNLAKILSMPPNDVPECILKKEGDRIEPGEVLARTKGIFGKFRQEYKAETAGTLESISAVTGQVIVRGAPLPVQVKAYLTGQVVEVLANEGCAIEADVTFVQGIFGVGGETFGPIRMVCKRHDQELAEDLITADLKDCVAVGGARVTAQAIDRARKAGVSAIIAGGIDDADLEAVLGYNLGVAITGSERIGLTVVITEGFGEIAMARRTFELLASREGDDAAVNGATQIRAGVMRPEIVIPLSNGRRAGDTVAAAGGRLAIGAPVRVIRDPYFGLIGRVTALPPEPQTLQSGSKARVLEVTFESGEGVIIPRANVELIEGTGGQES